MEYCVANLTKDVGLASLKVNLIGISEHVKTTRQTCYLLWLYNMTSFSHMTTSNHSLQLYYLKQLYNITMLSHMTISHHNMQFSTYYGHVKVSFGFLF